MSKILPCFLSFTVCSILTINIELWILRLRFKEMIVCLQHCACRSTPTKGAESILNAKTTTISQIQSFWMLLLAFCVTPLPSNYLPIKGDEAFRILFDFWKEISILLLNVGILLCSQQLPKEVLTPRVIPHQCLVQKP